MLKLDTFTHLDSEKSLLGCMLLDKDALIDSLLTVSDNDFFEAANKEIFKAMKKLHEKNSVVDLLSINNLTNIDFTYLATLTDDVLLPSSYNNYIDIIKENSVKRQIILSLGKINNYLNNVHDLNYYEIYSNCLSLIDIDVKSAKEINSFSNELDEILNKNNDSSNAKYGIPWIDRMTGGLFGGEITLLAARPGCGKSAFSLQVVTHNAYKNKKLAFFSLEMSKRQIAIRMLANICKLNKDKLRFNNLTPEELEKAKQTISELKQLEIDVYDKVFDIESIIIESKRLKNKKDIDLIIIDYAQLIEVSRQINDENARITYISRKLKLLAKELNVPILLLSQLNREGDNVYPLLRHLRGSGSLEQDADLVLFLYDKLNGEYEDQKESKKVIEFIIAKHREGEANVFKKLNFYGATQLFCQESGY